MEVEACQQAALLVPAMEAALSSLLAQCLPRPPSSSLRGGGMRQ